LNNFDLREAGADSVFDSSDDVIYRLTLDPQYSSGTTIGLFIEGGPLGSGHYRFIANSTLTDRSGNPLDGNEDGIGGDAYQHLFDIALPAGLTPEGGNNNTLSTATELSLTEDPSGGGYYVARGIGSILPSSDVDWWSFEALAGDLLSISVDTLDSDLIPNARFYNMSGNGLASDEGGYGPGSDAFISRYDISSTGTYYVQVTRRSNTIGSYTLRVDIARGIDLESDANYANDTIPGADVLDLTQDTPGHLVSTISGTVMESPATYSYTDVDTFSLGTLSLGNIVELDIRLPPTSTLIPWVKLIDSDGTVILCTVRVSLVLRWSSIHVDGFSDDLDGC
jgi:hypothetical protein